MHVTSKTQYTEGQTQHFGTLNPDKNYHIFCKSFQTVPAPALSWFLRDSAEVAPAGQMNALLHRPTPRRAAGPPGEVCNFHHSDSASGGYKSQTHLLG